MNDLLSSSSSEQEQVLISELIAQTALHHYHDLPKGRGKPQLNKEWTVFSALVATRRQKQNETSKTLKTQSITGYCNPYYHAWVVSCATGTKCTSLTAALDHLPSSSSTTTTTSFADISADSNSNSHNNKIRNPNKGRILKDSHAEVLTRRGFMRILWKEITHFLKKYNNNNNMNFNRPQKSSDESKREDSICMEQDKTLLSIHISKTCHGESTIHFQLKSNIQLHLYISDSPCGDASIYELDSKYHPIFPCGKITNSIHQDEEDGKSEKNISTLNYTGAKIILSHKNKAHHHHHHHPTVFQVLPSSSSVHPHSPSNHILPHEEMISSCLSSHAYDSITTTTTCTSSTSTTHIARELDTQVLSALRLKSCRSNITSEFRTQSHSCSDKLVRWIVLGLQGSGCLTAFIPNPIRLSSIIVSPDPRCLQTTSTRSSTDNTISITPSWTCSSTSTTIPSMSQETALKRAIYHRAYDALFLMNSRSLSHDGYYTQQDWKDNLPCISIVTSTFACSKAIHDKIKMDTHLLSQDQQNSNKKQKLDQHTDITTTTTHSSSTSLKNIYSPCGVCLNWQDESSFMETPTPHHDKKSVEVIVGSKGILQGTHPKTMEDVKRYTSRLSREVFHEDILDSIQSLSTSQLKLTSRVTIPKDYPSLSYQQLKATFSFKKARECRQRVLLDNYGPLGNWLTTDQEGDFMV